MTLRLAFVLSCLAYAVEGRRAHTKSGGLQGQQARREAGIAKVYPGLADVRQSLDAASLRALRKLFSDFGDPSAGWQMPHLGHSSWTPRHPSRGHLHWQRLAARDCNFFSRGDGHKPLELNVQHGSASTMPCSTKAVSVISRALGRNRFLGVMGLALVVSMVLGATVAIAAGPDALDSSTSASMSFAGILHTSFQKAVGGGKAGALAAMVQILSLMWLDTAMNYQYRFGGNLGSALKALLSQGGIARLYQGLPFALFEGSLARFGITAANVGVLAMFSSIPVLSGAPIAIKTAVVTISCGLWKVFCLPVDTAKVALQVGGAAGLKNLTDSIRKKGPAPLYKGVVAQTSATIVGAFPWLMTFNYLDLNVPVVSNELLLLSLFRNAGIGFTASCVASCFTNSFKVIKTTQQTTELPFRKALQLVIEKDGIKGLFSRGLKTRILTKAIEGSVFACMWKYFQQVGMM